MSSTDFWLLAKPAYKTHLNGELRKTFFKVKTGGEIHDFTIGSNYYHKNIVNTWSILYQYYSLIIIIIHRNTCAILYQCY